ncbi:MULTISPECIES: RICIN domain-containing protein [unclassified Streptomyces]|uniref:RICIN domain-containing protein n=1 Tax=unclassified Streptomyces TaxID=2593676 RepID=UPI00384CD12A
MQWGHITNGNSALCLAAPAASRQSGKPVNQYPCGDYSDHYWKTEPVPCDAQGNGLVRIVNYDNRQCLSVADSSTEVAAPVVQSTCEQSEGRRGWTRSAGVRRWDRIVGTWFGQVVDDGGDVGCGRCRPRSRSRPRSEPGCRADVAVRRLATASQCQVLSFPEVLVGSR